MLMVRRALADSNTFFTMTVRLPLSRPAARDCECDEAECEYEPESPRSRGCDEYEPEPEPLA